MAQAKRSGSTSGRISEYHQHFADAIIEQIKKGTAPWQRPWKPGHPIAATNLTTGKPYTGGNALYLAVAAQQKGYADNRWATFRQIKAAGGHVRRAERGQRILFVDFSPKPRDIDASISPSDSKTTVANGEQRTKPLVRAYVVFNVAQTDGLKLTPQKTTTTPSWQAHAKADAVIAAARVDIRHVAGNEAYYSPRDDQIVLPERGQFSSPEGYYQTALHELAHASGHPDRMNRQVSLDGSAAGFGSPAYAREELRAEIAAMMTGDRIGIGHTPGGGHGQGPAYVANWVTVLEKNPKEIHYAAAEAQRISHYLIEPARERIAELDKQRTPAHASSVPPRGTLERAPPAPPRPVAALSPGR